MQKERGSTKLTVASILVVEDDATQRFVIQQLCERFGYHVHMVCSGEDALNAVRYSEYAAVLLDLGLPGIDGFGCARELRRVEKFRGRRTPVIAVTARTSSEAEAQCAQAGMDDFMSKPLDPEEFRQLLLRWVYKPDSDNQKILKPLNKRETSDAVQ
ncbi:MAG: response regulator [Cyanobacteria bacterium]|nr:response regulator [Cyanobacteriota bacterium]